MRAHERSFRDIFGRHWYVIADTEADEIREALARWFARTSRPGVLAHAFDMAESTRALQALSMPRRRGGDRVHLLTARQLHALLDLLFEVLDNRERFLLPDRVWNNLERIYDVLTDVYDFVPHEALP